MTNDPANIAAALRSLAVYGVCALLAIIIGVLMTNPMTYSSLGFIGIVCAVLIIPFLLRWHHPLMIVTWSTPIAMFFIKGSPSLCLAMIALSLTISVTERALNQRHFISVPQITWPLCFLIAVILITAKLTGGLGLKAFGSEVYGGKKYIFLIVGMLGYFALTARAIPPERARWYAGLFFLGGALSFVRDLYPILPHVLEPIFWLIPPLAFDPSGIQVGTTRLVGTAWGATGVIGFMFAVYGLRGIFLEGKLWRPAVFFISVFLVFFGGFRSALISVAATFMLQFFLEGLHRTKLMPFVIAFSLACAAAVIPLASKLPFTFQRTLAFLPDSMLHLSSDARLAAEGSSQWRLDLWKGVLPMVPKYLLVGKGYAISMDEYAVMGNDSAFHNTADAGQQALALSGDYHNGPLSVIIPFGIWGALGFLWFTGASIWVLYRNYRYSDPALATVNTFLFTTYVVAMLGFYFIVGGFADVSGFTGVLGLSVAINRGVRKRPPPAKPVNIPFKRPFANVRLQPQPAFPRRAAGGPPR